LPRPGGGHTDSELIDLIYAAMLGEASWQQFLDALSANAPQGRTIFFSHNVERIDDVLAMTSNFEGPELDAYASHYVHTNPWLEHCAVRAVGLGVHSDEMVPRPQLMRSEFFNDFLNPNDIASSVGVTVDKQNGNPLIITTVTSTADESINAALSAQFTRIAPHLRRAARFFRQGEARWAAFAAAGSVFDAMNAGVVTVGENERIKTVSPAAQDMLDEGEVISVSSPGRLRLRHPDAQAVLRDMLARAYEGPKSVTLFSSAARIILVSLEADRISLLFEGPTVAVIIQPFHVEEPSAAVDRFSLTYSLTPSELRALNGIVAGMTASRIAAEANLSRETIRTQLKSLYAKTGTSSQVDLLRLVHRFR